MESAIRWLKASYLVGAVVDGSIGILMLLPGRMGETEFRYPMGLGASLMFGWTALLLWACRRPVERRGVLLPTIFPVIVGLTATSLWAASAGHLPIQRALLSSLLGAALILLFGFSYRRATVAVRAGSPAPRPVGLPASLHRVDFDAIPWERPMEGVRAKAHPHDGRLLRLVEYTPAMAAHWCERGHLGYVLEGRLEIGFPGETVVFEPGDGIAIPAGPEHRHLGRALTGVVRVVFVEDV